MSTPTYQKYQSFVEIRHRTPPPDVRARIQKVQENLDRAGLPGPTRAIVHRACEELLDRVTDGAGPRMRLHPNVVEEIHRLSDEELPRYLFYRYRYEIFPQRRILDDFPPCLQVEPSSICNYRCVFCYQTDEAFTRQEAGHMGRMPFSIFQEVVDQAAGRCEAVTLASRGEPLICPEIERMLSYAAGKFLAFKINTNAWFLDERKCHAILSAGVSTVVFSADAASEPAYSRFRVGGKLARVVENIRRFQEIREKHYPNSRTITRVSGVQIPGTPNLDEMERFWGDLVDQVAFVKYNPWENTYERPVNDIAEPCSDLWRRMFVWWDGTVNPCDVDYRSTLAVGNIRQMPLADLWRSEKYMQLREAHEAGRRAGRFPCNRCTVV